MTLSDYIAARLATPFKWGEHDCITFSIGWAEIATGKVLLPEPLWHSELQAQRLVRLNGGLVAVLDARFQRIQPNYAKDGDLAMRLGVVSLFSGSRIVGPSPSGLAFNPRTEAEYAWTY
jgi:hypothetical protein